MFDEQTGYYYDLQISLDGSGKRLLVNRGKGPEGWIPLWAKLAPKEKAERVIANMLDPNKFNTFVPLGTVSQDSESFAPDKYWRGPVWLDQAMYGIEALQNYGYQKEARELAYKIFDHAQGLLGMNRFGKIIILLTEKDCIQPTLAGRHPRFILCTAM